MSDQLDRIADDESSPEEADAILGNAVRAKFDAELKEDLEKTLREDYRIFKRGGEGGQEKRRGRNMIFYIAALAAGFALLILALNIFNPLSEDPQELAYSYLETSEIYHGGSLKGTVDSQDFRTQAIRAFNSGNYPEAEKYFSLIEEKTDEDLFYHGISALYSKKYEAAIASLELTAKSGSNFKTEATWYLAVALILNGDEPAAEQLLSQMAPSTWNYNKTQELLKALRK